MAFEFRIDSVSLSDGSDVHLLPAGVTAFAGPNNSGKSRLLREMQSVLHNEDPRVVVRDVTLHRAGSPEDIQNWLVDHTHRRHQGGMTLTRFGGHLILA
jgi:ABC-type cobalamin/Fe3+-siderophores transport system ATPase subunit